MDGVLFRGPDPLPAAPEFVSWLRDNDIRFQLVTNNSTATPLKNVEMLDRLGIEVTEAEVLTSSIATALYMQDAGAKGDAAYVIGEEGLTDALQTAGIRLTVVPDEADWVVAGLDRHVTYERLRDASLAIERGAKFIATNADGSLPVEYGEIPGAGALQAAITTTTKRQPLVIGKPEPLMLELGMKRIGCAAEATAMLGDRLDTDIEAAHRCGIASILVLTGVTSRTDLDDSPSQPTAVFTDLPELMTEWQRARIKAADTPRVTRTGG
jgi:4-nitrophenyl phosphatase